VTRYRAVEVDVGSDRSIVGRHRRSPVVADGRFRVVDTALHQLTHHLQLYTNTVLHAHWTEERRDATVSVEN